MVEAQGSWVLDKVKNIVLTHLKNVPAEVYLFGSWARNSARNSSDIDIAIEHEGAVTAEILAALRDALEDSTVPYNIDVVDLKSADPVLVAAVKEEGIPWTA